MSSTAIGVRTDMSNEPTTGITEVRTGRDPGQRLRSSPCLLHRHARLTAARGHHLRAGSALGRGGASRSATSIALHIGGEDLSAGVYTGVRLTTRDADADHAHLLARAVDLDPEVLRWPGAPAMFTFRDVDGNQLVIVEQS